LVIVVSYEPQLFKRPKSIFLLLCFFLLGISIYLYIPLRAHFDPVLNWGKVHDIKSFVGYLLRSQYRGDTVPSNYSPWDVFSFYRIKFSQPGKLAHFLTDDFGLIWLVAFLGIVPLALKAKRYLLAILAIVLMGILKVWPPLSTDAKMLDIGRVYLVFGYLGLAILMGMGFFYLLEIVQRKAAKPFYLLFAIIISFSGCVPLWLNFSKNDLSNNFVAYNYGRNVLSTLDRNAVLLASGDNDDFILVYLTQVEKIRPDVVIYDDLSGDVFKRTPFAASGLGEGRQDEVLSALLKKNNNPLYMTFAHPFVANTWYNLDLVGVVYKVLQENERVPLEVKQRAWSGYDTAGVFDSRAEEISEYFMRMLISAYYIQYGDYLLSRDDPLGFSFHEEGLKLSRYSGSFLQRLVSFYIRHGMLRQAEYVSKEVSKAYPDNADIFYNLGVYYGRSGRYERAIASWEKAIKIKPDFKKAKEDLETAKQLIRDANLKADRNVQK
ncbi:MAG: tetratricopeptide repeat protein, partial [Candidatus Omnitrophica bacterium]|nr:tetratricopeptide repeat protein [Candidatus Omnitrophota bacterium]